jgi:sugar phosphate isomerase/epimerase
MTRRSFLSVAAALPAVGAAQSPPGAAEAGAAPQAAAAEARVRLGYDAYSIRDLKWKDRQHIDYAVSLQLDAVQLSIPEDFASVEAGHLHEVRDYAAAKGIELSVGTGCICPTNPAWNSANGSPEQYLARSGAVANQLGLKAMRVFIGAPTDRHVKIPIETHIQSTLKALRGSRGRIQDLGLKIAIENHGDLTARELRALVEEAGPDLVGVNYDSGNPMWVMEDPAQTLELLAPFVVTSHFRDSALFEHPRGAAFQWVAMGDGAVNIGRVVDLYKQLCPGKSVLLEIITGRPPQMLPYLEDEWWKGFRNTPAADFARFVGLVKQGHAYLGPMVIGAPGQHSETLAAALREQQRLDLERSLKYCQETLKLGLRAQA